MEACQVDAFRPAVFVEAGQADILGEENFMNPFFSCNVDLISP